MWRVSASQKSSLTREQLRFVGHWVCPRVYGYWEGCDTLLRCWTGRRYVPSYTLVLYEYLFCCVGNINTATLTFDNYTVNNQAYLLVTNTSSFSTDITAQGYSGLVGKKKNPSKTFLYFIYLSRTGLGPNSGSVIRQKVGDASGDAMLNRIFQQNQTSQNYITFLLNRLADPGEKFTGQITISEPVSGFENITSQPKISVETVPGLTSAEQHWQILSDKDKGVIGPDGQIIKTDSIVPKAPDGQLVAVFGECNDALY